MISEGVKITNCLCDLRWSAIIFYFIQKCMHDSYEIGIIQSIYDVIVIIWFDFINSISSNYSTSLDVDPNIHPKIWVTIVPIMYPRIEYETSPFESNFSYIWSYCIHKFKAPTKSIILPIILFPNVIPAVSVTKMQKIEQRSKIYVL